MAMIITRIIINGIISRIPLKIYFQPSFLLKGIPIVAIIKNIRPIAINRENGISNVDKGVGPVAPGFIT